MSGLKYKIINLPIIKQVYNCYKELKYIKYEHIYEEMEDDYIDEYETTTMKFIWGIKSWDDLSCGSANLHTMNDIDLIYLKDENKYIFSIETIYSFKTEEYKQKYLKDCLDAFTEFMNESGYDTNKKIFWYDLFSGGLNSNTHFNTIEECYAMFKLLVNGYCDTTER